jgi:ureidoacrylate peracid hydrolase
MSHYWGWLMSDASPALLRTLAEKADPQHSALLVIDVQNDFVATGGFFDQVGGDVHILQEQRVPRILRLIDAARQAGMLVIFVRAIYDPDVLSGPMRERNARLNMELPRCISGSWGAEFYQVKPLPGEPVIIKHRYSAMVGTPLLDLLEQRGVRSLLLSGVATDTCVESAGRDAYFSDYYVTLVEDCCGGASEEDHRLALKRFNRDYGLVVNSSDIISVWGDMAPARKTDPATSEANPTS